MKFKQTLNSNSIDIPLNNKSRFYRRWEIIPGALSITILLFSIVLSFYSPLAGAIYVLAFLSITFVKGISTIFTVWVGFSAMERAISTDWQQRLADLEAGFAFHRDKTEFKHINHLQNINNYQRYPKRYPRVGEVYNLVIIAAYNETDVVLVPTIKSLIDTSFEKQRLIVCLAYEERGGQDIKQTAKNLQAKYKSSFKDFLIVEHPKDLPNEVIGKGGNITFAGKAMAEYLVKHAIKPENVLVTTLDADNRPHRSYFDYVTYEFIVHQDRQNLSYQPVSLYLNNIWDVPAVVRVTAAGNSLWNTVCTARIHKLRNFASHSQPMAALMAMNFWSTRTIVEDGHQYWRSYFFFRGDYAMVPIHVPIYQDAVLSPSYGKTLKDLFIQIRRWAYGVSDVPYVRNLMRENWSRLPRVRTLIKFVDLLEGHVSWSTAAFLILVGGWLPLLFNRAANSSLVAHQLPQTVSYVQTFATVGIVSMIVFFFKILPPRPKRYNAWRMISLTAQWVLLPISAIAYGSAAALYSQIRLMTGHYLNKFDVTDKNTVKTDK